VRRPRCGAIFAIDGPDGSKSPPEKGTKTTVDFVLRVPRARLHSPHDRRFGALLLAAPYVLLRTPCGADAGRRKARSREKESTEGTKEGRNSEESGGTEGKERHVENRYYVTNSN
jgi:hypothetical protein